MALPLLLLPLLGAALGAGTQAARGKKGSDIWKGVGLGALAGGFIPGSVLGGAAAAGGAGAAGAGAAGAGGTAAAMTPAAAELSAASGAGAAKGLGLGALMKQAAVGAGTTVGISAAMPQYGQTQVGQLPQMMQEDPMVALQQLMQRSKLRGTI